MTYRNEVAAHLSVMLRALPSADQASEMAECESVANGYLSLSPNRATPEAFAQDLTSGLSRLIEIDEPKRLALSAESPIELVMNLLPSDGHLD